MTMGKNHLKRIRAPRTWAVHRKTTTFIARPRPGGLPQAYTLPLSVLLKEYLQLFATKKELKFSLNANNILVNKKPCKEPRFPVGLFDIVTIVPLNQHYLITINRRGKLAPLTIPEKQSATKIVKITNKITLKGGKQQLATMDGRSFPAPQDPCHTGDSLLIELPSQKILEHIILAKGTRAFIFKGRHMGHVITIENIEGNIIAFSEDKIPHETQKDFTIVIGNAYPEL
jgi:small subunit ribosomal protein S4e